MATIITTLAFNKKPLDFYIAEGIMPDPSTQVERILKLKKKQILLPEYSKSLPNYYKILTC